MRIAGNFRCLQSFDWTPGGILRASYVAGQQYTVRAGPEHQDLRDAMPGWVDEGKFEPVWINAPHMGYHKQRF